MARITWQNVDAPNLLAAAASQNGAARSLEAATGTLGDLFYNADARQKGKGDKAAAAALLGIQSVDGFDKAAAGGNIFGALGVDPNKTSKDAMNLALGWRDRLEGDRATDLSNQQDVFDFGRDKVDAQRNDQAFARSEELRSIDETAMNLADEIARGSLSPQEAEIMIRDKTAGQDPRVYQAALQKLQAGGQGYWQTSGKALDPQTTQVLDTLGATLAEEDQVLTYKYANNPAHLLYAQGMEQYATYEDPKVGLIERVGATVSDEDQEAFSQSKGQVSTAFDKLKAKFPGVPPHMIAAVMENNLTADDYLWVLGGDNLEFDTTQAEAQLELFNTEEGIRGLAQMDTEYKREKQAIADTQATVQTLVTELSLLEDRQRLKPSETTAREIAKRKAQIETLGNQFARPASPAAAGVAQGTPEEAALAAAAQGAAAQGGQGGPTAEQAADVANLTTEERLANQNRQFRSGAIKVSDTIDRAMGSAAALPLRLAQGTGRALANVGGTLGIPGSAAALDWVNDQTPRIDALANEGLLDNTFNQTSGVPNNPRPAEAPAPGPAPQPQAASQSPQLADARVAEPTAAAAVNEIARAGGLPPTEAAKVSRALGVLESRGASQRERTTAMREIRQFIRQMEQNSGNLSDAMIEKLAELEKAVEPQ